MAEFISERVENTEEKEDCEALETLRDKSKMLVTGISSFSDNIFHLRRFIISCVVISVLSPNLKF